MKSFLKKLQRLYHEAIDSIFPRRCLMCHTPLSQGESDICIRCYMSLPFTRWHGQHGNSMERIIWAQIPIQRANALLHYYGGDESRNIVLALKYRSRPRVGINFGRIMAADLSGTDFFDGIDAIVPIPLSQRRQCHRGYNQSELLAMGVSKTTGIEVLLNAVERIKNNPSQTHLTEEGRKENVKDIFHTINPAQIRGKHLLLIDDVLTTGATVLSCAQELVNAADVRISILTLFIAGSHGSGPTVHK